MPIGVIIFISILALLLTTLAFSPSKHVFKIEKDTSPNSTRYNVYELHKIYNLIPFWECRSTEFSLKDAQTKVKELQSYKTEVIEIIGGNEKT